MLKPRFEHSNLHKLLEFRAMKDKILTKIQLHTRNLMSQRAKASKCLENEQIPAKY